MPDETKQLAEIPYPAVFRDWRPGLNGRVSTTLAPGGIGVDTFLGRGTWKRVELTEEDACLLAASLLQRAGRDKLARKVLRAVAKTREAKASDE